MSRRIAAFAISGLVVLLLAAYGPTSAVFFPIPSPLGGATGTRTPDSAMAPLPEFSGGSVIWINYTWNGTAGASGVFWTELYYRYEGESSWTPYKPPWNPSGQWSGHPLSQGGAEGTILFDTYFTGGEQKYEFTTVAVDRGYWREPGPPLTQGVVKAKTILDTRPPSLFIVTPAMDSWTKDKLLKWVANDTVSGVAKVAYYLDGELASDSLPARGETALDLKSEGLHTIVLRAWDRAGNVAEIRDDFRYDPNSPSLSITSPAPDSYLNTADVQLTWTAGDSGSGIASFQLIVDSKGPVSLPGTTTVYDLPALAERSHFVSLMAMDQAGNTAIQTLAFGVDRTKPDLAIISPADASYANTNQLLVLWAGSDSVSGIDHFIVSLDDRASPPISAAAGYTFKDVTEAAHVVKIEAVDRAGNVAEVSAHVTVDTTPPTVSVSAPGQGATVYGTVNVDWTVSDSGSGVSRVELLYDSTPALVVTGAVTHQLASVSQGPHVVAIRAWDLAGNMAEANTPFLYGGAAPPAGPSGGLPALDFWILMAIIGAIAIGSAYYAVRRRKRARA